MNHWIRVVGAGCAVGLGAVACGGGSPDAVDAAPDAPLVVGVSWANYQQERWARWDEPALQAALAAAGATYISVDAMGDAAKQAADIRGLVSAGVDAIVVLPLDAEAVVPPVEEALAQDVHVVAYDRPIDSEGAFYVSFDTFEVGRLQASAVLAAAPTGNYVIVKGSPVDPNSEVLRAAQGEVLADSIAGGDIRIVGEAYTDNWDPANAYANMTMFLAANDNDIQAVVAANDGTAEGAIAALDDVGLAGTIPVSGQDGDPAALHRIALGLQTVSVWQDPRLLGAEAASIAVALARDTDPTDLENVQSWTSPGGVSLNTVLLAPIAITRDNLQVVLDAGWIAKDTLCEDVPPDTVAVCS